MALIPFTVCTLSFTDFSSLVITQEGGWYGVVAANARTIADFGVTVVWLPPPTDSVSAEGYMPRDLYNLNSRYGSAEALRKTVKVCKMSTRIKKPRN